MKYKEICQRCERVFLGGPRQFLCPRCLKEAQRRGGAKSRPRKKEGKEKGDVGTSGKEAPV